MKVLLVTYGGGHVAMMLPVMKALREREQNIELVLMALTMAHATAVAAGEIPLGFADFISLADHDFVKTWGARLTDGNSNASVSHAETEAYLGVNYWDLVQQYGASAAKAMYEASGRAGFYPLHFFRRLLQQTQPDLVIATSSPRSEQAAIDAAVELGIPTLAMVDQFALAGDPFLKRRIHADNITVLCNATRDNLVRAGVDARRIIITGNAAFDELSGDSAVTAGLRFRTDKDWGKLHIVLWAGHKESADAPAPWAGIGLGALVQKTLVRWLEQRPGAALVVRYHPNEWRDFPVSMAHPRLHWSKPDVEPLLPVLAASDQVVVQGTTTGIQAVVAGKRVIALRFSPFLQTGGPDLSKLGLAEGVERLEDLPTMLDAGLHKDKTSTGAKGRTTEAAHQILGSPGGAAARIAEAALALIDRRTLQLANAQHC